MITYKLIGGHKPHPANTLSSAENPNELDWSKCRDKIRWSVWGVIQPCACDPGYAKIIARIDLTGHTKGDGWWAVSEVSDELNLRHKFPFDFEDELIHSDGPIIEIGDAWEDCNAEV